MAWSWLNAGGTRCRAASSAPHDTPIARAQAGAGGSSASRRPSRISATRVTRPSARSRSCVATTTMAPSRGQLAKPPAHRADRSIVEAGERLVEQHEPRAMQQRAFERQPLPHARARSSATSSSARSASPARSSAASTVDRGSRPYKRAKNVRFWRAVSSGVQVQLVREQADAPAQLRCPRRARCCCP